MIGYVIGNTIALYQTAKYSWPGVKQRMIDKEFEKLEKEIKQTIEVIRSPAYEQPGRVDQAFKLEKGNYLCFSDAATYIRLNMYSRAPECGTNAKMLRVVSDASREAFEDSMSADVVNKSIVFKRDTIDELTEVKKEYIPFYFFDQKTSELFEMKPELKLDTSVIEKIDMDLNFSEDLYWEDSFLTLPPKITAQRRVAMERCPLKVDFNCKRVEESALTLLLTKILTDEAKSFFEVTAVNLEGDQLTFEVREKHASSGKMKYLFKVGILKDPNTPLAVWESYHGDKAVPVAQGYDAILEHIVAQHYVYDTNQVTIYGYIAK